MLLLFSVALIPTFVVGSAVGAGPASVVGGFVALFSLIAFLGGPLRPDLRLAAVVSPVLLFSAIVPRLLSEISRPAAIAVVVVIVFVAALLPVRGPRFVTVGLGLGMVTLFAYGMALTGPAGPWQVVVAAVTGLAIAVVLRVLFGVADPSKPTREKVADVLDSDSPALEAAFDTWLSDGLRRWLGEALGAASRYRLALHSAEATDRPDPEDATGEALTGIRARAHDVAERLRAKKPGSVDDAAGPAPAGFLADAAAALDAVERASADRRPDRVPLDTDRHRRVRDALRRPTLRLRSIQLRHAVRTAFGLLLVLVLTAYLPPGDPLVVTALLTTFGILQASWRETFDKARPRVVGLVAGAVLTVLILLFVPAGYLLAVAGVALVAGLWNMTARPALAYTFMVCVTVGFNTSLRHLDPGRTLVEYAVLTLAAVVVGVVVGFAVVPGLRPEPLRGRIVTARTATVAALRALADPGRSRDADTLALQRRATQARADLTPDREKLDDDRLADLDRFRTALRDLSVLGTATALDPDAGPARLGATLDGAGPATGDDAATGRLAVLEPMVAGLAEPGPRRGGAPARHAPPGEARTVVAAREAHRVCVTPRREGGLHLCERNRHGRRQALQRDPRQVRGRDRRRHRHPGVVGGRGLDRRDVKPRPARRRT
ncbi:putative membrane protein YccC [Pseudonocardia sediminis]|uniref:Putative membrane protein YccC n=2 Tax=Pseudonocardia sediminis TaxID=1397368 RepID=A0A4V2FQC9_PSEST|nr:putative membrane protein YccC [Pseudonocardia sediminis]